MRKNRKNHTTTPKICEMELKIPLIHCTTNWPRRYDETHQKNGTRYYRLTKSEIQTDSSNNKSSCQKNDSQRCHSKKIKNLVEANKKPRKPKVTFLYIL